ncbi:hypothetical protein ACI8AA_12500 [Geodermatophilus sp. SYSU D01180]
MRTYDPADGIRYVHLAQDPGTPPASLPSREACHRLPAGYPNASLRARLGGPRATASRPALVLLPGGSAAADAPAPVAVPLRLAR